MRYNIEVSWHTGGIATFLLWVTQGNAVTLTPVWSLAVCDPMILYVSCLTGKDINTWRVKIRLWISVSLVP